MQSELQPGTTLFAGRYTVTGKAVANTYGFTYPATDISTGSQVYIQEFFPHSGCHRNPQTLDMAIRRVDAPTVSAMYKEFTLYVTRLKEGSATEGQPLIHAFKDHGTAYYVTEADDSAALESHRNPSSAPHAHQPATHTDAETPAHHSIPVQRSSQSRASSRNAILWYRIVIFLLACIVLLLVYLNFLSPSPKVRSAYDSDSTHTEQPYQPVSVPDSAIIR